MSATCRDALLMHLAHPMMQHALGVLTRCRYPGGGVEVSRWTVRSGGVPEGAGAKALVKERLKPDFELFLQDADLFQPDLLGESVAVHDKALSVHPEMHTMPVRGAAERARTYREGLLGSSEWRALERAMNLWCACWFWPADETDRAPLPSTLSDPPEDGHAVAERIAAEMRFFHWELEFPDVFREAESGFDAMLGNPPWEIAKPVS